MNSNINNFSEALLKEIDLKNIIERINNQNNTNYTVEKYKEALKKTIANLINILFTLEKYDKNVCLSFNSFTISVNVNENNNEELQVFVEAFCLSEDLVEEECMGIAQGIIRIENCKNN